MNRSILMLGTAAISLAAGSGAQAGTLWIAQMSGANENPPTTAPYTGTGFLILNDAETIGTVYATHNISIPLTGGYIHRGTATVNGPIIFPFPAPASPVGPLSQALLPADVAALKVQGLYMNFHTAVNPGGAIRGTLNRSLLSTSASNASQMAVANALDVSAGLNADLDQLLMAGAVATSTVRAQALDDLSGRTVYATGRQAAETMAGFEDSLFAHAETMARSSASGAAGFAFLGDAFGSRDNSADQAGSKVSRPSILVGFDFAPGPGMSAGIGLGYADGREKFKGGMGKTEAKTTSGQAYLASAGQGFVLSAVAGYGKTKFDIRRSLGSISRSASASPDGTVWSLGAKAAFPIAMSNNGSVSPYGLIDMQRASVDAYTETGAGAAGLVVAKRSEKNAAIEAGAELVTPLSGADGLTVRLAAGWRHLLDDGADTIALNLVGSPVAFQTKILSPGKNAAHLAASIGGNLSPNMTLSAGYRGLLSSDSKVQALELRLTFRM